MLAPADLLLIEPPAPARAQRVPNAKPRSEVAPPDPLPLPVRNKDRAQVEGFIVGSLSADEVAVLAAFYFDGQRQREIAEAMGRSQGWVSKRLASARHRLTAVGVALPEPHQVRVDQGKPRFARCEPAALDQLVTVDDGDGPIRGRWIRTRRGRREE